MPVAPKRLWGWEVAQAMNSWISLGMTGDQEKKKGLFRQNFFMCAKFDLYLSMLPDGKCVFSLQERKRKTGLDKVLPVGPPSACCPLQAQKDTVRAP